MSARNIILTGIPRSGTTLTCNLLDKVSNVVALHEPMDVGFAVGATKQKICTKISTFFFNSRNSILNEKKVLTKHASGKLLDNTWSNEINENGLRIYIEGIEISFLQIEKNLTDDFILCIKHNGLFTLLLNELNTIFDSYAIVRNPLAILASWNSVNHPLSNGHLPVAESVDHELSQKLEAMSDKFDRQFYILSWFFNHYKKTLPAEKIIRYEDIISSGGSALQIIVPEAITLSEPLINKNLNQLYNRQLMITLAERLLNAEGDFWHFYTRDDVRPLIPKITE